MFVQVLISLTALSISVCELSDKPGGGIFFIGMAAKRNSNQKNIFLQFLSPGEGCWERFRLVKYLQSYERFSKEIINSR